MIICLILLGIALVIAIIYIIILNDDINTIHKKINWLRQADTNNKLTTDTFNKSISKLICEINEVLEKERQIEVQSNRMNKKMKQIITNISHDLRTPLTSAIGYIQLIKDDKVPDEKKEEYVNIVETRLKVLSKLLEDFFDFTKIIENKIEMHNEKINISNLLNETLLIYYEEFINKNITPQINIVPNIYIYSDINGLKRIFQNIIQNALVHGKESLEISLEQKDKTEISFKNKIDNKVNIETEKLFERFYTADLSRTNKNTGLGLAIVKEIVNQMNGKVTAKIEDNYLNIMIIL